MFTARQRTEAELAVGAHVATEVAAVLDEMLVDLEVWDSENQWRQHQRQLAAQAVEMELLHSKVAELESQQAEAEAETRSRGKTAAALKESLCSELWTLSKTLKSTHALERKLERAEDALAKVPKLERDLENALRAAAQAQAQAQAAAAAQAFDNVGANSTLIADGDTANSSTNSSRGNSGTNSGNYPPSNAPRITDPPKELVQWLRRALGGKKHRKVAASYALNLCQSLGANPNLPVEAVVRLNLTDLRQRGGMTGSHALLVSAMPPVGAPLFAFAAPFMCLEDKVLLKTFSYLQAWSVLATAQVCRPFFTRVDALFGMGSTLNDSAAPLLLSSPPNDQLPPPPPYPGGAAGAGAGAPLSNSRSSSNSLLSSSSSAGSIGSSVPPPDFAAVVSKAQAAVSAASAESKKSTVMGGLAKKVASKLSSTEMKAIVQMTDRIKRLEASLGHAVEVKDDLDARLSSAESVKEFLVDKLKDTELVLKKTIDGANEAARQHHADQEVINFLDGRVVELEQQQVAQAEVADVERVQSANREAAALQQVKSLEEMLEWQRTQSTQATRDAAAQKKVLVKEVKKLRAALRQVSEDRDTYQRQANMLMARGKK